MRARSQLVRWGNSLAVRLPKGIIEKARLAEGEHLNIDVTGDGRVSIGKAEPEPTLEQLVARITPRNRHGEIPAGSAVGREILDEW